MNSEKENMIRTSAIELFFPGAVEFYNWKKPQMLATWFTHSPPRRENGLISVTGDMISKPSQTSQLPSLP
jgi:hypothetical protein